MSPHKIGLLFLMFIGFVVFIELFLANSMRLSTCADFISPMNSSNSKNPTNTNPLGVGLNMIVNNAVLNVYDTICGSCNVLFMGDDHNGCALGIDLLKDLHHILGCAAV